MLTHEQEAGQREDDGGTYTFRTSFAQQRLWFLDQYEPGTGLYNIPAAWRLQGELDRDAVEQSLNEIIRRHETLRTTFAAGNELPVQIIVEHLHLSLSLTDLSAQADAAAQAECLIQEEAKRPFDLAQGPLIRAGLIKVAEREHIFLLTLHHIISDGWSMGVLMRELSALYRAFSAGQPSPLSDLPIQYADFAVWQRDWLQGDVLQEQLAYWKRALGGAPPVLELPTDRPRPAALAHHGASVGFDLGIGLSAKLRKFSQRSQVTLFMTVAAVFNVLLHRYSRQDDICIGYPVANRNRAEIEGLIGFFVNTLVLRTRLAPEQSFGSLLKRVREAVLDADAHQDLPFEKLVEELRPERNLTHSPLFQVMFAFYNADDSGGGGGLNLPNLQTSVITSQSHTAKFDLSVDLMARDDHLFGVAEYNTDLFDRATIERMVGHYGVLLEAVVADPQAQIKDLPLLSEAERHQLLVEWNDTETEFPSDRCIHELFEEQVARRPDAVAVAFEDRQLTYSDLNGRANQLAHYLRSLGVKPNTLVGICVERSLEMVVGLLGILKAGGAYVPLDPDYPQERLAYMLEDTGAPVLLTQVHLEDKLPKHQAQVVCLDSEWASVATQPTANPEIAAQPDNLAYVIYTSGSTGRPKGAMNVHHAVVNRLLWMQEEYRLDQSDRVLQKTPLSFDVSVWEFFWPLLQGAQLVIARPEGHKDPAYLMHVIQKSGITTLHFVPSMLQVFLSSLSEFSDHHIHRVFCGGEALPYKVQEQFFEMLPHAELHNLYGPTEAAVDVTYWPCRSQGFAGKVPIGRPIANTRIYILDPFMQPVPIGVTGELYIGGLQVGRGYWNRPSLTAERFVPDPFGEPGSRMYRTGDLGCYLPDGDIEFLGRIDHQVKIRGFRIELGEVESTLLGCEGVREAVVVAREDTPGDKRLVAYVVAKEQAGQELDIEVLRSWLKAKLPEYMMPSAFVRLEALPLSPNGKLDRKALPAPDGQRQTTREYVAPRTELEKKLAEIWAEVLKLDRVGINDNFFALGGHSLLAIQIVARTKKLLDVEISVRDLFSLPTVSALSQAIGPGRRLDSSQRYSVTKLSPQPAYQMSPNQLTRWRYFRNADWPSANMISSMEYQGASDKELIRACLQAVVLKHEALATQFTYSRGARLKQCVLSAELVVDAALTYYDTRCDKVDISKYLLDAFTHGFKLLSYPLFRFFVHVTPAGKTYLTLIIDHIICDGTSLQIFWRDFFEAKERITLTRPNVVDQYQYGDYCAFCIDQITPQLIKEQKRYWDNLLEKPVTPINFGGTKERPKIFSYSAFVLEFSLNPGHAAEVREFANKEGVSLFAAIAGSLSCALHELYDAKDVLISSRLSHRSRSEFRDTFGWFLNSWIMRLRPHGKTVRQLSKEARDQVGRVLSFAPILMSQVNNALSPSELGPAYGQLAQVFYLHQGQEERHVCDRTARPIQLIQITEATRYLNKLYWQYDLYIVSAERDAEIKVQVLFNKPLFDETGASQFLRAFKSRLCGVYNDSSSMTAPSEAYEHRVITQQSAI